VALGGVDVQPRAAWGADLKPTGPLSEEAPGDVRFLLVHHTASPNGYSRAEVPGLLRGFYGFHTTDKKWPDLAYGFMVDRFGQVWEGRTGSLSGPVKGDATGGSQGFAVLCCFIGDHAALPPSAEALDAMGKLLGALAARHGIDVHPGASTSFVSRGSNLHPPGTKVNTPTIAGHREMSKTTCPGDACYPLIRSRLIPGAVVAAGATSPSGAAPPTTPTSSVGPAETLPAGTGAVSPDPTSPDIETPPPTTVSGGYTEHRTSAVPISSVVAGATGAAVLAAGGLVGLLRRRRGKTRESDHWDQARREDA